MFVENEFIRYMMPLDADYSYGTIIELKKGRATVKLMTYPHGMEVDVPYRFMEHIRGCAGRGSRKSKNSE